MNLLGFKLASFFMFLFSKIVVFSFFNGFVSARSRTNRLFFATESTEGTEIKFELLVFSIYFILCLCSFKKNVPPLYFARTCAFDAKIGDFFWG